MMGARFKPQGRWLLGGVAALALASVAAALVSQHVFGQQPCPWCVLQRVIAMLVALAALLGLAGQSMRIVAITWLGAGLAVLLSAAGGAAALWQHFVAAESASCAMTLADRIMSATGLDAWWPEVFAAFASCADAKATLMGLPYEYYSLAIFVACAVGAALAMRPRRR